MIQAIDSMEAWKKAYEHSVKDPEGFWAEQARTFQWMRPWKQVLDWEFKTPRIEWFKGARLNITQNCLDRHLPERAQQTAFIWEPNDPKDPVQKITYSELHRKVCHLAHVLRSKGIKKGDRICLYMPMVPEAVVAMLACARIGAVHSVVFAGFSAKSLADRMQDAGCVMLITSDGLRRGTKELDLKAIADEALALCPTVEHCLVLRHIKNPVSMQKGRDSWWHQELTAAEPALNRAGGNFDPEPMDAEDPLFILYTSGSTGKPKGVEHHCGGYMVYAEYSFKNVFQYLDGDVWWCTADIGWVTGHTYIVYGPLLAGATGVGFEGIPTWPDAGRFWEVCDKHQVNIFYTAPTAIRALMAAGDEWVHQHARTSLKTLGSVGEPINAEAWQWYHDVVGRKKCSIVDTWWQTETGGILISGLAHITPMKPTFAGLPLPGIQPCLMDADGKELKGNGVEGNLALKFPWPGMIRSTWGDHERCRQVYFSTYPNKYFTGDGCRRDEDGFYRITGRVDDVINVSGHRIGTAEVESACDAHPAVVETAVVGFPHAIKGQGIYAFCILEKGVEGTAALRAQISEVVSKEIGPIAKPDVIQFASGLPKTRSGKIMRRILRKLAAGDTSNLGDTSTLLDPGVVEELKAGAAR